MNKLITIIVALLVSLNVSAESSPEIEVTGTATIDIVPDRITVEIGMEEYYKPSKNDSVIVKIGDIEKRVRGILSKAGVKYSDITVSDIGNYLNKSQSKKFLMGKSLNVVLNSFNQLEEVASLLGSDGIQSFRIVRLDNSDMSEYDRQGMKAALLAARSKAEFMAGVENMSVFGVWKITESNIGVYEAPVYSNVSFSGGAGMESMKRITKRYTVRVLYLLKY